LGGFVITAISCLSHLEFKNAILKQIVTDLFLEMQMLQHVLKKMPKDLSTGGFGSKTRRSIQGVYSKSLSGCNAH
jgi:hypothetical protein